MQNQKFAYIPEEFQSQQITWLRLSFDPSDTEGVYLLLYKDLSKSSLFDYWFKNADDAILWAKDIYGVKVSDWRTKESLENEGFKIIDER